MRPLIFNIFISNALLVSVRPDPLVQCALYEYRWDPIHWFSVHWMSIGETRSTGSVCTVWVSVRPDPLVQCALHEYRWDPIHWFSVHCMSIGKTRSTGSVCTVWVIYSTEIFASHKWCTKINYTTKLISKSSYCHAMTLQVFTNEIISLNS